MNAIETQPLIAPRSNMRVIIALAITATIVLIGLLGLRLVQASQPALASGTAPAWELKTFDGQQYSLADLRGRPVVLNFWASWCQPCRQEAPMLEAAWEQYKTQGVLVIGVDYVDTETEASKYLQEFKITYPNGPDLRTSISQLFRIKGVPETYFIGKDGRLADFQIGPFTSEEELQAKLDKLLK
jgi:cytochrome c biogenesis protein CcmG/thiol:disulfide interchange protein DsbE